jgi:hypothetical protein
LGKVEMMGMYHLGMGEMVGETWRLDGLEMEGPILLKIAELLSVEMGS